VKLQRLPSTVGIRSLVNVVRCGGFTAAEKEKLGHRSVLRRDINSLQDSLGTKLVEGDGHHAHFFRAAYTLVEAFEPASEMILNAIARVKDEIVPELEIISSAAVARVYLPHIARHLDRDHPNLRCGTDSGTERDLRDRLVGDDSVVAVALYSHHWKDFARAPLLAVQPAIICPRRWSKTRRRNFWARQSIGETLFYSAGSEALLTHILAGIAKLGCRMLHVQRLATMDCVINAVTAGRGIGVVVDTRGLLDRTRCEKLPGEFAPLAVCAFWWGTTTTKIEWALEAMRQTIARLRLGARSRRQGLAWPRGRGRSHRPGQR
jgi:DNA-binding transcriptional LysR family regulator